MTLADLYESLSVVGYLLNKRNKKRIQGEILQVKD